MLKKCFLLFFIFITHAAPKADKNIILQLFDSKCNSRIYQKKGINAAIIALHSNENTCIAAFGALPDSYPFVLYELMQKGNRLLECTYNTKNYYFDPNRIFSKEGIIKTLSKYNKMYPESLVGKVKIFSDTLLKILLFKNASKYIIAVHNNTDGGFSVKSFANSLNASITYVCKSEDPDDFFLVTQLSDFRFFKEQNKNVVLQNSPPTDDGSLSVYCQSKKIPYINIEAQNGHQQKQTEMLLLCAKLLSKSH